MLLIEATHTLIPSSREVTWDYFVPSISSGFLFVLASSLGTRGTLPTNLASEDDPWFKRGHAVSRVEIRLLDKKGDLSLIMLQPKLEIQRRRLMNQLLYHQLVWHA